MPVERDTAKKLIDLSATLLRETERAYQLDVGTKIEWVPKSQVQQDDTDPNIFTMPEWLARDKGFI